MLEIAGIELLPDWPVFLSFVLAGLALNVVPGADMTFIIASAARGGRRDGVIASLGVGTGALVHILAAVLGLSAILASSQAAFNLIKWIGAAYLLWLAFSLVRSKEAPKARRARPAARLAAVPRGDAGQHPQSQGRALLPRLPAAIRRPGGGRAGAPDPLPRPVVRHRRDARQHRDRRGRRGRRRAAAPCRLAGRSGALVRAPP